MRHEKIYEEINDSCFYLIRNESVLIPCNVQLYYTKYLQSRHTQVMATHWVPWNFNYRLLIPNDLQWYKINVHFFVFNCVTFTKNSATLLPGCYLKSVTSFPRKELRLTFPILTKFLTRSIRKGQQSLQSLSLEINIRNNTREIIGGDGVVHQAQISTRSISSVIWHNQHISLLTKNGSNTTNDKITSTYKEQKIHVVL